MNMAIFDHVKFRIQSSIQRFLGRSSKIILIVRDGRGVVCSIQAREGIIQICTCCVMKNL